jgi:polysaccharide pyruvyl transferase WcaK-like protein
MIYHVYANQSNIGDWLSAKGIQKLLSPLEITECFCDVPFVEETMERLSGATSKDLIVIGGGGLLMDYFIPFWEAFRPIAQRIPFCIWGIGFCDIKNEFSLPPNALIEEIINKSKLCIVRDELSRSYLKHCKLPAPVPCPSINVIEPVLEKGRDILHVVNYTTAGANTYDAMVTIAKKFASNSAIQYRETNNLISSGNEKELNHILSLYQKSSVVISSALHGCIIGVAMGLKVLAVSGDRKIEGFMESAGLKDWVLDVNEVNLLPDLIDKIREQSYNQAISEDIQKKNQEVAMKIKVIVTFNNANF